MNPTWKAEFKKLPTHPITQGVAPFALYDEWYYHMRFPEGMTNVTAILSALPPASTLEREDGPHSGNAAVRAAVADCSAVRRLRAIRSFSAASRATWLRIRWISVWSRFRSASVFASERASGRDWAGAGTGEAAVPSSSSAKQVDSGNQPRRMAGIVAHPPLRPASGRG